MPIAFNPKEAIDLYVQDGFTREEAIELTKQELRERKQSQLKGATAFNNFENKRLILPYDSTTSTKLDWRDYDSNTHTGT